MGREEAASFSGWHEEGVGSRGGPASGGAVISVREGGMSSLRGSRSGLRVWRSGG